MGMLAGTPMTSFPTILAIMPTALEAGTAAMMWHRKLHRELPTFFSYLVYQCLWALALFLSLSGKNYVYTYWVGDAVSMALGFAVIYELFAIVLQDYEAIRNLGFLLYKWSAVVLLFVAVISCATTQGSETNQWVAALLTLERGVRIVQCGLLAFLFLFAKYLGLSWRSYAFGVALGFALFVSVELVVTAARWHAGTVGREMYYWLKPLSFDCATLIWAVYVLQREPKTNAQPRFSPSELDNWNLALRQLVQRQWN